MRIKKIIIENFKSIDHLEITDLSNLNIFIGKNDAGKSNILDAIDIIFNADLQTHFPELVLEEKNLIAKRYKGDLSLILHDRLKDYFDISLHLELSTIELKKLNLSKVLEKANFSGYESGHELVIKRRISTDSKAIKPGAILTL